MNKTSAHPTTFEALSRFAAPLILILNIVFVLPVFLPGLSELTSFDDAFYINNGRELTEGILPLYAHNPFVALFYALIYIPVQSSPFWLVHSCRIGRFLLFGLLWLSSYLIAKRLSGLSNSLIITLLLLVSPVLPSIITNGSDALFAAMSGFCFWKILSFYYTKNIRHLWLSSVFVALAALSRNEGLILFLAFIPFCVLINRSLRAAGTSLVAWIAPFIIIVVGYVVLYGLATRNFELGIAKRAYSSFEQGYGQAIRYLPERLSYLEGVPMARRIFGTPEENNYSVIAAIRRNPEIYFNRAIEVAKKIPFVVVSVYGGWLGIVFFLLAARGIIELVKKKLFLLLCILLLWPGYLLLHLLFLYRTNHFLTPYFIVFSLASVGIVSILSNVGNKKESFFRFSAFFVLIIIFCVALLSGASSYYRRHFNRFRALGTAPDEKAVMFMKEHLHTGARVGTFEPKYAFAAKVTYVPMYLELRGIASDRELSAWIDGQNLKAIFLNADFRLFEPSLCALIERQIGKSLKVGFASKDGDIKVLLVTPQPSFDLKDE
ncbi:MAG: hypothetical protein ABIH40_05250 [Candidatus Omnitrophota bacterium]